MRIGLERGIVETDTQEEANRAAQIVADYAQARKVAAQAGIAAVMPSSKRSTLREKANDEYLDERKYSLRDSAWRKYRGVIKAFLKTLSNLDAAMVSARAGHAAMA